MNQTLNNLFPFIWDNIRDIIFILSADGEITSITREFEVATKWKREEWIGRNFVEIVHPEDVKIVIDGFQNIMGGESPPPYEARVKAKNGEYLIFEAKGTPHIENGEIIGYLGIARDVTERRKMEEVVKNSERQYRAIFNSVEDPFHVIDPEQTILLINPTLSRWLQELELDSEIIGKSIAKAFPFLDDVVFNEYDVVFQSGKPHRTEEMNEINEVKHYTETRKIPIFKPGSSDVIQVLTIIRDITQRKQMEEELKKSEERLRSFMDAATDSFSLWDSELNLVHINSTAINIFRLGFPKEELIGNNIRKFVSNPNNIAPYLKVLKTGEPFIAERASPPKTFGDMMLSVKAFKVGDGLGLITTDITERKRIEDELRESEEKFRSIFANAPIGMVLVGLDYKFSQVNTSFCEMIGYTEREILEMTFNDIIHSDHIERDTENAKRLTKGAIQFYQKDRKLIRKDGSYFWANATVTLLKDKEDNPLFLLGMIQDITATKEKEEDIKSKLLKFKIEEGMIYLIKEASPILSQTVFKDLIEYGYSGTIISRSHKTHFKDQNFEKINYYRLTTKNGMEFILKKVKELSKGNVLLLDRVEFLFLSHNFKDVANFIFQINEHVYLNNSVVLFSVDPTPLKERDLNILEKETLPLEEKYIAKMAEEYLSIIRYIFQENKVGIKPSYSDIGSGLNISRPTVRKRVKYLVSVGYLSEHRLGKTKRVELTSRGELLFVT